MIKQDRHSMWRYDAAFPLKSEDLSVTFHEGMTPLAPYCDPEIDLRIKMDYLMPTGSFKDRGTVMIVNQLIRNHAETVTEDSSGNAGASVALYCAAAQIPCEIYVPATTSPGKILQIQASGATLYRIEGTREDVALAAQRNTEGYAGHNWHPFYLQGMKSIGYELWEQNGFRAPENIVAVTGNGGQVLGMYLAFEELLAGGEIDRIPRIFAVQADNCNPIYRAFSGMEPLKAVRPTLAEGIALQHPCKIDMVTGRLKQHGGGMVSVSEEEIKTAILDLTRHGFYMEPTSAAAYAGLTRLYADGTLKPSDEVVMMASGSGMKAGHVIAELSSAEGIANV